MYAKKLREYLISTESVILYLEYFIVRSELNMHRRILIYVYLLLQHTIKFYNMFFDGNRNLRSIVTILPSYLS